jgi:hypothetical protein
MEDPSYINGTKEFRLSCGLETLKLNLEVNFSGEWKLNNCESIAPAGVGINNSPYKLNIVQTNNVLTIKAYTISEYSDDEVTDQTLTLDGKDNLSKTFMDSPRVQNATWTAQKDTLTIDSKITVNMGGRTNQIESKEVWTLKKRGNKLDIKQTGSGFMSGANRTVTLVYDRQ